MADKIKPHVVERVKIIREWENKNNFREAKDMANLTKFKNYYVPQSIVDESHSVLSFGVGGDAGFEKAVAFANKNITVQLFDPTPYSKDKIEMIINRSSRMLINKSDPTKNVVNRKVSKRLHFTPIAYSDVNGVVPFYYDPARESDQYGVHKLEQSFSLVKRGDNFKSVNVETKNLESIMKDFEMTKVDILKADIEGLWWQFGHDVLDKKIDCKFVAMEFELNFEPNEDIYLALDKAQIICDKFKANNYDVVINRRRDKLMLEMLFIRKDSYEG